MKWAVMYATLTYIVFCADDVPIWDEVRPLRQRVLRAAFWPITVTQWFRTQNLRIHRMLTIVWVMVTTAWLLTLLNDRFFE